MPLGGNLDYALTRVHARHGQRMDEGGWRRLESTRDLGQYLATVRTTQLADWANGFDPEQDCHTFERALRVEWRSYVDRVAGWHPLAWQAWLAWLAWLPGLNLLAQLARREPAPAWMLADPVYGPLTPGTPADRAAALARTALAPLRSAVAGQMTVGAAWQAHWHSLRPSPDARTQHSLELLLQAMRQHEQSLARATDSAELARAELASRLQRLLRIAAGTVIVTACHLGLVALDLERLRGGLARRRLFSGQAERH